AETRANRLTAFDILHNGELKNRRVFAETSNMYPDGICLDEEGAIWVADPKNKEVIRIKEGGEITDKLELETRGAYACMLGGNDGKTLFICTNTGSGPDIANQRAGRIETTRVKIAKAGRP
ncbi:MAG: SMP-30/gluconolactonase/LRE family protein, partial [Pseudomonadota bacterium]|nr:SMP-30/gluconolactonase/LRE family protein [Pseudomonadota bacterium]